MRPDDPLPVSSTEVSLISAEEFAALLVPNVSPEVVLAEPEVPEPAEPDAAPALSVAVDAELAEELPDNVAAPQPEAEPDQADVITLRQESEKLAAAIAALPEKQRDLIQRAYFGDLSHSEIAEETGLPLGTIKSRIRLALERLRHAMG